MPVAEASSTSDRLSPSSPSTDSAPFDDAVEEVATLQSDGSTQDAGREGDQAQEQESDPQPKPEESATASEQPPAPSEPANDNQPAAELPATGTE